VWTERVRVERNGNVGIGTNAPISTLNVGTGPASPVITGTKLWVANNTGNPASVSGVGTILSVFVGGGIYVAGDASSDQAAFLFRGADASGSKARILFLGDSSSKNSSIANVVDTQGQSGHLTFDTAPSVATGLVERMRITSAGNVGIGTSAPNAPLEVSSNVGTYSASGNSFLRLNNTNATGFTPVDFTYSGTIRGRIRADYTGQVTFVSNYTVDATGSFFFYTGGDYNSGTCRMVIGTTGNVGLGTGFNPPSGVKFHIETGAIGTKGQIIKAFTGQTANLSEWQNSSGTALASVSANGAVTIAPDSASAVGLTVKGASGLTANLQEWRMSDNVLVASIADSSMTVGRPEQGYFYIGSSYHSLVNWVMSRNVASATGSYTEILKTYRAGQMPIEVVVNFRRSLNHRGSTKVYKFAQWTYDSGHIITPINSYTNHEYEGETAPDDDFELELVTTGTYETTLRIRRTVSSGADVVANIFVKAYRTYGNGSNTFTMASGTGTSSISLSSTLTDPFRINVIRPALPAGFNGNGNSLSLTGGNAKGTGNGGDILLQAGAYSTSGSNGKVIVRGLASNTANLQEWQNSSSTALSYVASNGDIFSTTNFVHYGSGSSTGYILRRSSDNATMGSFTWVSGSAEATLYSLAFMNIDASVNAGIRMGWWNNWADSVNAQVMWYKNSSVIYGLNALNVLSRVAYNTSAFQITAGSYATIPAPTSRFEVYGDSKFLSQSTSIKTIVVKAAASQTANLTEWQNNAGTALAYMDANGNFYAVTKSFLIDHPTPEKKAQGKKLRYASLEGPENGVYFRGRLENENEIVLPDYWKDLVDEDSITVNLTARKYAQPNLFVADSNTTKITVESDKTVCCDFIVYGTRKDVAKLEVEIDGN
jgi:hypothetical protein